MGGAARGYGDFRRAARRPRRGRGRRLDARPLARPDDHDGLRGGEGRVRREAAEPVRPRGPVDGRRRPAARAGRPGRHPAAVGAALSEGAGTDPERPHRPGRLGADVVLPQRHARLRLAARRRAAARARLRPLARPGPEAAVQPEPVDLSLPLVLGLLGRADDQPRASTRSTSSTGSSARTAPRRSPARGAGSPPGQRRDARHPGRALRIPGLVGHLVAAGVQPGRGADAGAGVLRHAGKPGDLAQGLRRHARPRRSRRRTPSPGSAGPTRSAARPRPAIASSTVEADRGRRGPHRATSSTSSAATPANFLDCVQSRRDPISDLESGHRVATACHLANLSLRLGRKLRWDAGRETIVDDLEAEAMLERPYRPPWDAVLKSLLNGVTPCH